eukprot:Gb_35414 [translate_table: standard]
MPPILTCRTALLLLDSCALVQPAINAACCPKIVFTDFCAISAPRKYVRNCTVWPPLGELYEQLSQLCDLHRVCIQVPPSQKNSSLIALSAFSSSTQSSFSLLKKNSTGKDKCLNPQTLLL